MESFVFITAILKNENEDTLTFVVLEEKIDTFVNDWKCDGKPSAILYVNQAVLCLNGSVGKGDYLFTLSV